MNLNMIVAGRVRDLLSEKGHTQDWLATETGIPMRTLARRLNELNPSPFTVDELHRVATVLRVPAPSLLTRDTA